MPLWIDYRERRFSISSSSPGTDQKTSTALALSTQKGPPALPKLVAPVGVQQTFPGSPRLPCAAGDESSGAGCNACVARAAETHCHGHAGGKPAADEDGGDSHPGAEFRRDEKAVFPDPPQAGKHSRRFMRKGGLKGPWILTALGDDGVGYIPLSEKP